MAKYSFGVDVGGTTIKMGLFDLEGNVLKHVTFTNGCNGNLKAISSLGEGLTVEEVEEKLKGITCGFKSTSCGDQLAQACLAALEVQKKES